MPAAQHDRASRQARLAKVMLCANDLPALGDMGATLELTPE